MEWNLDTRWRAQIERQLNRIGSQVKGNQDFQADRVADLVEQIDELRQELKRVAKRQDKIADYIKGKFASNKETET